MSAYPNPKANTTADRNLNPNTNANVEANPKPSPSPERSLQLLHLVETRTVDRGPPPQSAQPCVSAKRLQLGATLRVAGSRLGATLRVAGSELASEEGSGLGSGLALGWSGGKSDQLQRLGLSSGGEGGGQF